MMKWLVKIAKGLWESRSLPFDDYVWRLRNKMTDEQNAQLRGIVYLNIAWVTGFVIGFIVGRF